MSFMVATHEARDNRGIKAALAASVLLHGGIVAAFLSIRPARPAALPPIYKVNLIAAAPGPPAAGVVAPTTPVVEAEKPAPPRPKSEEVAPVKTKAPPRRVPKLATPSVSEKRVDRNAPAPVAAGGEEGGRGTDVRNIRTEGIDFPYPGYLENIVRQIALRFQPPRGSQLKAEVMFLIKRDGSISGLRFVQRSGSFTFDLEAQGAIEAAATKFGPLPDGFRDDVLPVMFSFDPRLIR
ncbi:MAG: TonB C-terminal domain-containing protein [Gemmatimonadaceae bacterium]